MTLVRRYQGVVDDSILGPDGFQLRPGDIIISTPPKCGTTWTQTICASAVLQEPELPLPLDSLSPWIDMVTRARTEVFAHSGGPDAPPLHQDPHATRWDPQRSDGHVPLHRA